MCIIVWKPTLQPDFHNEDLPIQRQSCRGLLTDLVNLVLGIHGKQLFFVIVSLHLAVSCQKDIFSFSCFD